MSEPFDARLRGELVAAADRRHGQRVRRRRVAMLSIVVLVIGAAVFAANGFVRSDEASAGVDIKVENGQLTVRLTDLESRPDAIRQALDKAGLPVSITSAPVGPSDVGRFVSEEAGGPSLPPELHVLDAHNSTFAGFVIPVSWPTPLTLVVGRPANAGEHYITGSNAFAEGEPLACSGVFGQSLASAPAHIPAGLVVRALTSDGTTIDTVVSLDRAIAAHPDYLVATAAALSSTEILLTATPDGRPFLNSAATLNAQC